ncbi:hypothetical protein V0R50_07195 [Pseudomonas sp. 148P]|uniref:Uncharacterized protein n=1 Tax=Pseudomonas ulcerans TaxID=3115852 RepID=A0ABU7HNA1_9PSED|nr:MULTISPECIES: hypothetical protein [unclassified Pseudomonas]MEE1922526.1 hypothetical protein [Pseudomonas sp. 147P]MEE1933000.1 hypothetical protein [Pseudomonas sp. 148P]
MIDLATWSKGMWLSVIGFGILMLIAAFRLTKKLEELHHKRLFKEMTNSNYMRIIEHQLEISTKRKKKSIRDALNHILLFPDPFFSDGRISKEDMEKVKPLMDEWIKTNRIILAFPLIWIVAFTVAMKIYTD